MLLFNKEVIASLLLIYFFSMYKSNYDLFILLIKAYKLSENFVDYYNSFLSPKYLKLKFETTAKNVDDTRNEDIIDLKKNREQKYEDKYLEEIRKLDKNFQLDQIEENIKNEKCAEFITILKQTKFEFLSTKLIEIEESIKECEKTEDNYCISDSDEDIEMIETKEEQMKSLLQTKKAIQDDYTKLQEHLNTHEGEKEIIKEAQELANNYVINKRLEKLMNCCVMEKTPLGNVIMIFNNARGTFTYYSDSVIPYRYLEVVARKYVKIFSCRPIFVDMDEELQKAEKKWEIEKNEKEEERRKLEEMKSQQTTQILEPKKSVFAKFKSYNKDTVATKAMVGPPKNSIPNKPVTAEQENEKILLKTNANRYTYEGKLSNFNFLKKIERKIVDKKYALSFSDFKKLQIK